MLVNYTARLHDKIRETSNTRISISMQLCGINKSTIWATNNIFPLNVINTHCNPTTHWKGTPDIINLIHEIESNGFSVSLQKRCIGDETNYPTNNPRDYKLVISEAIP
tara:strand:+ start:44042 stop:44365 length:324 start_codon:yes stop_codon:yes gene_type:complete